LVKSTEKTIIEELQRIGLSLYEAKVYFTLLIRGTATASEISDLSGIPYTRVYDVLNQLEEKGFVASIPGRPLKFEALDPGIALSNYIAKLREELVSKLRELEENIARIRDLLSKYKKGFVPREKTICLRGRHVILNYLKRFLTGRDNFTIYYTRKAVDYPEIRDFLDLYKDHIKTLKIIDTPSILISCDEITIIYEVAGEKRYDYMIVSQSRPLHEIMQRCLD